MKNRIIWGDPMSYSDVEAARAALRKPNRHICIRCLAQALNAESIPHRDGCPEAK